MFNVMTFIMRGNFNFLICYSNTLGFISACQFVLLNTLLLFLYVNKLDLCQIYMTSYLWKLIILKTLKKIIVMFYVSLSNIYIKEKITSYLLF